MKKILMVSLGRINSYSFEVAKIVSGYSPNSTVIISTFALERGEKWNETDFKNIVPIKTYKSLKNVIPATIRFIFKDLPRIKKLAKQERFDIIYAPQSFYLWLIPIVKICNIPRFIITIHDPNPHSGAFKLASIVDSVAPKFADDIIILSESFRTKIINKYNISNDRVYTIPCGLYNIYDNSKKLDELNYSKKCINFVFFGRIEKYKGLSILLEACRILQEEVDISLTIIGRGNIDDYSNSIKCINKITVINRYIDDNEVKSCFIGPNLVLVLPYIDATQSGPIVLAQKFGVPIIATNTGAIPEQLEFGRAGFLCMPNSVSSLLETMRFVIENPLEVERVKERSKMRARKLRWEDLSAELIRVFEN